MSGHRSCTALVGERESWSRSGLVCVAVCHVAFLLRRLIVCWSPCVQVEHHLFPGFCHFYYPAIAPIVQQTCKEFDVPYHCFPTVRGAAFEVLTVF